MGDEPAAGCVTAHKTQNVMLVRPNLFPSISRLHLSYAEWNIYGIVIRRTAGRDCTLWLHAERAACIMSFVCEFWKVIWRQLRLFGEHKYYMAGSRCSLDLRAANPTVPRSKRHSLDFNCLSTVSFDYCQSYTTLNVAHKKSTAYSFNLTLTWKLFCFHKPGGSVFMSLDRYIELLPSGTWL